MIAFQRTLTWTHGSGAAKLSKLTLESLLIASPLVVQAKVNRLIATIPDASETYVIYDITPIVIFRHLFGPSSEVKVGDHLLFADKALRTGAEYSDDQLVRVGTAPILFMTIADSTSPARRAGHVYVPTAPFVSKWFADVNLRLHVMSTSQTAIAALVKGQTVVSLSRRVADKYGIAAAASERNLLLAILGRRGITTNEAVATYASQMQTTDGAKRILATLVRDDEIRANVTVAPH